MSNVVQIIILGILVTALFSFSLSTGYVITKKSKRAGILFATAGSLSAVALVVSYFEEIPAIIIGACFAAFLGALLFAAFEVARKDVIPHPT